MAGIILMPAAIASAGAPPEEIKTLCRHVQSYQNRNSADYVPGVDVHGNPVEPADLNNAQSSLISNPVVIPIEIDLATRYGLSLPTGIELEPTVASIEIYNDGHVTYNGRDITKRAQTLCAQEKGTSNNKRQLQDDRHSASDPVLSSGKTHGEPDDKIEGEYPPAEDTSSKRKTPDYND